MSDKVGVIRRTDFQLRSFYPEITTTIYQLSAQQFVIHVQYSFETFQSIEKKFNYSIKPITAPVTLVDNVPVHYEEIIAEIPDSEAPKNFEGISMTRFDLMNLLLGKFPMVYFTRLEEHRGVVKIFTCAFKEQGNGVIHHRFLSLANRTLVETFLMGLKIGVSFELIEEETDTNPGVATTNIPNPIQVLQAPALWKQRLPLFSDRDETLWYDNVEKIFTGEFIKADLFFYDQKEYSCYVDYSTFDNLDIRNFLFLFETIYLTPPISKDLTQWLKERKIKKTEFFELVKRERIKILLTQPEYRYDLGFLTELFQESPNAVVSRRALAALQQIDIIQLANNYILNDPQIISEFFRLSEMLGEKLHGNTQDIYELLVWPLKAKRQSFEVLNRSGSFGIPTFGINRAIEPTVSSAAKRDLEFEFAVCAPAIHLAHALNATYFPYIAQDGFNDAFYADAMGGMLNIYRNTSSKTVSSLLASEMEFESGILPINPIKVIDVNTFDSILDLETILSKDVVYPNSKRLLETLAQLPPEERQKKIDLYNKEVHNKLSRKRKRKQFINLAESGAEELAGAVTGLSSLGFMLALLKWVNSGAIKNINLYKNTLNKIDEALHAKNPDKANIHYLTKINRVAKLRD